MLSQDIVENTVKDMGTNIGIDTEVAMSTKNQDEAPYNVVPETYAIMFKVAGPVNVVGVALSMLVCFVYYILLIYGVLI